MIFFGSFCVQCVYLFIQCTQFVEVYCTSKMFFILYPLQKRDGAKNNNFNVNVHTRIFGQYFKIHVTTMNDTNEFFFLPNVYSKNTNVCQFVNRELTQPPRRWHKQRHKFAYLTMTSNSFARFARTLLIF